jgi:hypothetical protein
MSARVTLDEIASFELRDRCAWAAICAETLTKLYSSHFQQTFKPEAAFAMIWTFIATGAIDSKAADQLLRKYARMGKTQEAYQYGLPNAMLAALVAELRYQNALSLIE